MGIAYSTGVMSQLGANIYVALVVALVLKLFSAYLYFVPRCVLNAPLLCFKHLKAVDMGKLGARYGSTWSSTSCSTS